MKGSLWLLLSTFIAAMASTAQAGSADPAVLARDLLIALQQGDREAVWKSSMEKGRSHQRIRRENPPVLREQLKEAAYDHFLARDSALLDRGRGRSTTLRRKLSR